MKKLILTLVTLGAVAVASADEITQPSIFTENFYAAAQKSDAPPSNWVTYGNGAVPGELDQSYFDKNGLGPYYALIQQGSQVMAMATTDFEGNVPADQWLITPEFEVPYDASILSYQVCTYNPSSRLGSSDDRNHPYKILISESGAMKEDFVEVKSDATLCTNSSLIETNFKWVTLNGYKGKKVRLAFVVTGSDQGFTGFTDINWSQYYIDAENLTLEVAEPGQKITVDYNLKIRTPQACSSVLTKLYVNGELSTEKSWKKAWGATGASTPIQRMKFLDVATMELGKSIDYRLELIPQYEGAEPTVIEGSIGTPNIKYPNNVVIEELTGTKCGYCPTGIGALNYYNSVYNTGKYPNKVIPIAVHNTTFGNDPMALGVENYNNELAALDGATNMPAGIFNRSAPRGCSPMNAGVVEDQFNTPSDNQATITSVVMPLSDDVDDVIGKTAIVNFDVRNGYNASMRGLSAAVVLIENNVTGNNATYNQSNSIANQYNTGAEVVANYAAAGYGAVSGMAPFLDPYVGRGELALASIPFKKMVYNEVARGIYPSFEGSKLNNKWEEDVPQSYTIEFEIPQTVMNINNTEVVVLITSKYDQTIVASDILPASKYSDISGVAEVSADSDISIKAEGNLLRVKAAEDSVVEAYSLDGVKLGEYNVNGGQLNVSVDWKGLVVVKVAGADGCKSAKLIF